MELRANPDRKAAGVVIEAEVEKGRGVATTLLVQKGTLKIGNIVVAGHAWGRVRAIRDAQGSSLSKASPSMPVEVLGFDRAPFAGDEFAVVDSEKVARDIAEYREKLGRDLRAASEKRGSLEDLFQKASDTGQKELPIIIKADVQGSVEAIVGSLGKVATEEVKARVLHTAVGGINESDIALARASNALILGFNVRASNNAKQLSEKEKVDIRYYSVIYDLVDDMKAVLGGMLNPTVREQFLGSAEIREVFNLTKYGKVAGCYVTDGVIKRGSGVRLLRDNVVIHEGKLKTLKRFKDDMKEVSANFECGMAFENYDDMKAGDVIEAFETIEEQRSL
jgi:translation initiation factor IF-2